MTNAEHVLQAALAFQAAEDDEQSGHSIRAVYWSDFITTLNGYQPPTPQEPSC